MRAIKTTWPLLCGLLVVAEFVADAQPSIRIAGVDEPPELTGEPKKVTELPEAWRRLMAERRQEHTLENSLPKKEKKGENAAALKDLNEEIREVPDWSDGYFLRATLNRCLLRTNDTESVLSDVNMAISTHATQKIERMDGWGSLASHYGFRAKLDLDTGHYREAMDDLEQAMAQGVEEAENVFPKRGGKPDAPPENPCDWSLSDLDSLGQRFPQDYRSYLFRGLYLGAFSVFPASDEKYYRQAIQAFERATEVSPTSPLPYYFLGYLHWKASFQLKPTSEEKRTEANKKAIQGFTRAIQANPRFERAYELRADSYWAEKQEAQAIGDYGRALELNPECANAYGGRGEVEMELGRYAAAIRDFGEAIGRTKPGDSYLGLLYEHRAEAYTKAGDYRHAISDLSKGIARQLAVFAYSLSLRQLRGLYPEYNAVSDAAFCRKVHDLFLPEFEYDDAAKRLRRENPEWQDEVGLQKLYEKRGNAYLAANDLKRAVLDFNRIFSAVPGFSETVDRWRPLSFLPGTVKQYVDVKSAEIVGKGPIRLWVKTVEKDGRAAVGLHEFDCEAARIRVTAGVAYDAKGAVTGSSEISGPWQRIIPDTQGERLYQGFCSGDREF